MNNKDELKEEIKLLKNTIDKLEEQQKVKNIFFASTVHELRTPLNAIIGLITILLDKDIQKPESEYISQIHTSSKLLVCLVNDILDFSKIEAGKIELENIEFSLDYVLNNVKTIINTTVKEKELNLLFEIDDNIPKNISTDPLRLIQILINLSTNAIKFTDIGTVTIKAKLLEKQDNKEFIEFCVSDTGIGLTSKQSSKLFGDFVQVDNSISREYGGSGLGLNISKKLTELMGGSIRIESEIGKGSDFIFTIELKSIENITKDSNQMSIKELEIYLHSFKDSHILLAEDNIINQSLIIALLKNTGIEITIAHNGKEALDIMDSKGDNINLILMNLHMPVMSGIESISSIRNNNKYYDIPIIAFSGDSSDNIINELKDLKVNDILLKPIVVKDFYQMLIEHLQNNQTIENRYISSAKEFDSWLENYQYQKIISLIGSIKHELKTSRNEDIINCALNVERSINNYRNLFLVLIKNYTKVAFKFKKFVDKLESNTTLENDENLKFIKITKEFPNTEVKDIISFANKVDNSTAELIALANILNFHKATEFAFDLQKEAKSLGIISIVTSISPIVGIETTKIGQLREELNNFKYSIEDFNID